MRFILIGVIAMLFSISSHAYCEYLTGQAFQQCVYRQQTDMQRQQYHWQQNQAAMEAMRNSPMSDQVTRQRQQPCEVYHHGGYLGGPEQPDAISVYGRNC